MMQCLRGDELDRASSSFRSYCEKASHALPRLQGYIRSQSKNGDSGSQAVPASISALKVMTH
jgi:hypothetical protein